MLLDPLPHVGRVDGMEHADYLAVEAVSASGFKALRRSPAHFHLLSAADVPREPKAPTPQQFAGTLMHCALLEPGQFTYRYPVGPDVHRASKEWKAWTARLGPQCVPVSALQSEVAQAQAAALLSEPNVAALFARPGTNEVSIFWRDETTGLACKARPDRVIPTDAGAILFDGKTAVDASRAGFARAAANFYYHTQAAWYVRGWRAATGEAVAGFVFGVVENEFPYIAAAYMIADEAIEAADAECSRMLGTLAQCERAGHWPGYPDGMREPLQLPGWTFAEDRIA